MKESIVYIDNFFKNQSKLKVTYDHDKQIDIITGYHFNIDINQQKKNITHEIFKGLLLNDIVYLNTFDIPDVIRVFGITDFNSLVSTNRIGFIDDNGSSVTLNEILPNKYELSNLRIADDSWSPKNCLEWVESRLSENKSNNNEVNSLMLNLERNNKIIDFEYVSDKIITETAFDLKNNRFSKNTKHHEVDLHSIDKIDALNVLRLGNLNKTLIYASYLNATDVSIDAEVQNLIPLKFSPLIKDKFKTNVSDEIYSKIISDKGIPDLSELYLKRIITINDFLGLIESFGNNKLRAWIKSTEFNPHEINELIKKSIPKINPIISSIRWAIPNAIGILSTPIGIATSFVDSYIVEKLISGWHPNLFLDNYLKKEIDKKIKIHQTKERINSIKRRFPNIGRNDICPCGKNMKFKNCCGK
jgi:hypothetical protein